MELIHFVTLSPCHLVTLSSRQDSPLSRLQARRERWFYLLISPWLIGFVIFQGGALAAAFLLSFAEWKAPQPPTWVGLEHFRTLSSDPLAGKTVLNTITYTVGTVPTLLLLGLVLALLLHQKRRGVVFFRTLFFLPVIVSGVALTLLWGWLFNARYGLINVFLAGVGVRGPAWLQDEQWAMPALILMALWNVGTTMIIYLAALQNVPRELYDAAAIDGANRWQKFRFITWPLISPATFYLIIVNTIAAFQVFTPAYILTRGGPANSTLTIALYIYFAAFRNGSLGYASVLSLILFFIIVALTIIQFRLADRWVFYLGQDGV